MVPAVPPHSSDVVDRPWDGPANEAKLPSPITGAVGKAMYAWYDGAADDPDGDGYPDAKSAWKLPHHEVDGDGKPGPANLSGVRNALSRLPQSDIPGSDHDAVRRHLQRHLDAAPSSEGSSSSSADADGASLEDELRFRSRVLAVRREILPSLAAYMRDGAGAERLSASDARRGQAQLAGGVAVIPLRGLLTPRLSLLNLLFGGGGGLSSFRSQLRDAAASEEVSAILIEVDSPGGVIDLIPEIAADIRAAREAKPVVAVANTEAASGAYWLAAQAEEVVVTPSGEVGSIGVYMVHEDWSGFNAQMGIDPTYVFAGRYKVEANPDEPLADDARSYMQQVVDEYYGMFVADVAKGRGTTSAEVRRSYGEGRMLTARRAVQAGLADRVDTLEGTFSRLARGGSRRARRAMDATGDQELLAQVRGRLAKATQSLKEDRWTP